MTKQKEGIWIIDANAHTLYANQAMADILGTTIALLRGQPSFGFVFPEDIPTAQLLFDSKKSGDPSPFSFRLRRVDGSAISVTVQGTPMHNAAGQFLGVVGTFTPTA